MGKKNDKKIGLGLNLCLCLCLSCVGILFFNPRCVYAQGASIKTLFEKGQEAFEAKRYQDAINNFEAIIEKDNGFAAAYHALGLIYQEISPDPSYPLWYFQTAIEIDPQFAPSYDMLCRAYHQLQDYVEAEKICTQALKLNPDLTSSQLSLAWVYLTGRNDPDRALYYFEKVIQKVQAPAIYFGMGMAYAMQGDHAKVLDIVTQLRAKGFEQFASHLEAAVRSKTDPEKFMPPGFLKNAPSSLQETASQGGQAPIRQIVPVPVPVVVRPRITGSPQIHIKGKIRPPQITGMSGYSEPKTFGGQDQKHPGGLSDD